MKKYSVISLFSGAMGLDLGLLKTNRFQLLACVEKEKVFCDSIRANHEAGHLSGSVKVYQADISKLSPLQVLSDCGLAPGELDLLVGGPPCQSFSTAGKRGTVQDTRGTLLWEFLRFVDVMRPRFFIMENVRGLLSAALQHRPISQRPERGGKPLTREEMPGSVVSQFADDLQAIDGSPYHMDCFEVNAVNYGAPQLRERAIFIGNRYNSKVDFPNPTHGPIAEVKSPDLFSAPDKLKPWSTLRDALSQVPAEENPVVLDFSPRKKRYLSLVPPGSNWRSLPIELQQESMGHAWHAKGGRSGWWRRLTFDLPAPTLMTMPNHASTSLCHPTELRALSLKEYAAIQEFPSNWIFCGTTSQQYAQVGNAVPVRLGEIAGSVVATELDRLSERRWRSYKRPPESYRVVYIQSHVRTRQWFKGGKTLVWQDGASNDHAEYDAPQTRRKSSEMKRAM